MTAAQKKMVGKMFRLVVAVAVVAQVAVSASEAPQTKRLIGRAFFAVAEPNDGAGQASQSPNAHAVQDMIAAATGHHRSHHAEGHKGKKGGDKKHKSGYVKGHDYKDKKGYHQDDHFDKHSFGNYAKGHHSKHKEGGGKGYKGSEHKQKHKGGFKKGDEGAKGKKVGHKGKFHKGHHDKGFKNTEDHDAHGHKHDDSHKMIKNKYGSSYEEEEGYYKKGKGKKHEGGKFAGGKTWDHKGGDSFSIKGKYHEDYSDIKGKFGYDGEEHHAHKKGAKGGHKKGKSHKKGDDHKGHHSHYAPVKTSISESSSVNRQGIAYDGSFLSPKTAHSSHEVIKKVPEGAHSTSEHNIQPRQYQTDPRRPPHSKRPPLYRNEQHPHQQQSHQHPREQTYNGRPLHPHQRPTGYSNSHYREPSQGDVIIHGSSPNEAHKNQDYRVSPPQILPKQNQNLPQNQFLNPNGGNTHHNPHRNPHRNPHHNPPHLRNPHIKLHHHSVSPNVQPFGNPKQRPHPNAIPGGQKPRFRQKPNHHGQGPPRSPTKDNKSTHSIHSVPLHAPHGSSGSALRTHSQSIPRPQHSQHHPQQNSNHFSQPEVHVTENGEPQSEDVPHEQEYPPQRGFRRRRPRKYKKPVYGNEVQDEDLREQNPDNHGLLQGTHSDHQNVESESPQPNGYHPRGKVSTKFEEQRDSKRENQVRDNHAPYDESKRSRPNRYRNKRPNGSPRKRRPPPPPPQENQEEYSDQKYEPHQSAEGHDESARDPDDESHDEPPTREGSYAHSTQNEEPPEEQNTSYHHEIEDPEDESEVQRPLRHQSQKSYRRDRPRLQESETQEAEEEEEEEESPTQERDTEQSEHIRQQGEDQPSKNVKSKPNKHPSGGAPKKQLTGFYYPNLGHPVGFNNFAVGASNAPVAGAQQKLEPSATGYSLGHTPFTFDSFGDFGKFLG
ncbi:sarcoplasmic reticulum histidine-rich calcium-binding protein isoform X2 [Hyalella azteca]|uniref:Sarcoplasmic reticulum histidine-rich calcium-binding protein isoform X2 n=1 Tax=Hyalella azteca TaxID=294128 RepID=A0A979FHU3_HYAAZ|nr:sarcoplasmic reticulum histidine-rich calcium-binding protein isoform X2 [Hyalella azteca]